METIAWTLTIAQGTTMIIQMHASKVALSTAAAHTNQDPIRVEDTTSHASMNFMDTPIAHLSSLEELLRALLLLSVSLL